MTKVDYETNQWVADYVVGNYEWVSSATANEEENYSVMDVSITTDAGKEYPMEVKRIMGGPIKNGDEWNEFFYTGNTDGMMKKMDLRGTEPGADHIYILNAEDYYGNEENSKWAHMLKYNACLAYVAKDGILFFSPKKLKEAFCGYGWYLTHHNTLYKGDPRLRIEKKALIDLSKGSYIKADVPKKFFRK